jgi:hypothetical protein
MHLENLLKKPADSPDLHFREAMYGTADHTALLQEVMGLANADIGSGHRYILFGVLLAGEGKPGFMPLPEGALKELQTYADIVNQYLEPDLKVAPLYGDIQGNFVAALEISLCTNPPYVVKLDVSAELRRGACWVREGGLFRPAQRADLDRMYRHAAVNNKTASNNNIVHVGLGHNPNNTRLKLVLPDVMNPPSLIAASRIQDEINSKRVVADADFVDTGMDRLIHARLYGNESNFKEQGLDTLMEDLDVVKERHRDDDDYYYQEANAVKINLSMVNTGHEALEDVSIMLILPVVEEFKVVDRLVPPPGTARTHKESELLGYPKVNIYNNAVHVKYKIDRLEPDQPIRVFDEDLRIGVLPQLAGRKVRISYSLHASGFKNPEQGRLTLLFSK